VIVRSEGPLSADVDTLVALLSIDQDRYFMLDAAGSSIWRRIETPTRISDLCAVLVETFDVTPEACERDVLAFIDDLIGRDLVKLCA
jgi:coenzyme PQQ synthesis protein D (PqqD)